MLKTENRVSEGIDAYRRSIALDPSFGEAYWSLANLKTFRFEEAERRRHARRSSRTPGARRRRAALHFHFALGKAFEDAGD